MRMYPVRGSGEARLRAKTVFICVYHGWEYHWRLVRQCGGGTGRPIARGTPEPRPR
jgi:hypothetical protein